MAFADLTPTLFKNLGPVRIFDLVSLLTIPVYVMYRFDTNTFDTLLSSVPNLPPVSSVDNFVTMTLHLLVTVNFACLATLMLLLATVIIQGIIRFTLQYSNNDYGNAFRSRLTRRVILLFFRLSLYSVSMAMYAKMLFNDPHPIQYLHSFPVFWVTTLPLEITVVCSIIGLMLP